MADSDPPAPPPPPKPVEEDIVMEEVPTAPTLEDTIKAARKAARKKTMEAMKLAIEEYMTLIVQDEPSLLAANIKKQEILAEALGRFDSGDEAKSMKEANKIPNKVPRNMPLLQLSGDHDVVKGKAVFETIDRFLDMIELVLYQHGMDPDEDWEAAFIATIIHSTDKSGWFKETLMNKSLSWKQARMLIQDHFGGSHSQSHYLDKLNHMAASKWEDPLKFVERFYGIFRSAGVIDSVAYGSILLKALASCSDLVKQIKSTYASTPAVGRPELNVSYIYRTVPHLYVEPSGSDNKKRTREGDIDGERGENRRNNRRREKGRTPEHDKRFKSSSTAGPSSSSSSSSNKPAECRYCHQKWFDGHRCKQYYETKTARSEYRARMARLDPKGKRRQDFTDAMQDLDIHDLTDSGDDNENNH
ncbi:hypothetical protein [Absidia glauca]|uniref:Retrotransposon gag domain-containing protein n=1 Tax=Absidia glauca TaxID=4829 RepID=A0A168MAL4_ABSGL|nr:hypothetical protein [Absidia glauca]